MPVNVLNWDSQNWEGEIEVISEVVCLCVQLSKLVLNNRDKSIVPIEISRVPFYFESL